jgi:hypothetical protein
MPVIIDKLLSLSALPRSSALFSRHATAAACKPEQMFDAS